MVGKTAFIQANSIQIAFTEWPGERGPVICLPSLTWHRGSFRPIAERLSPDYRLFALDLRGRGDSDRPADGYGFAYHAADVLAFADQMGFDRFVLMGHSFGATASVYLASIRPQRVQALVLIDGGVDPDEETLQSMRTVIRELGETYASADDYVAAMRALPYLRPWGRAFEQFFREDVETLPDGRVRSKSSAQAIERDLDQHFVYSMCLHFPAVRCPTLFLRPMSKPGGERGQVLSEAAAAALTGLIAGCQRVDLPDANHATLLLHDDPPVVPPIRAFLREVLAEAPAAVQEEKR